MKNVIQFNKLIMIFLNNVVDDGFGTDRAEKLNAEICLSLRNDTC